jgi:DNA-binding CsgD family transcriptional regulator
MQCGPFATPNQNDSFILSIAFIISTTVLSLALSTDVAVRNRIETKLRQRALETEVLWQATVQVAFGGSYENLLRSCLERICRVTGWHAGHVYLPDDTDNPSRLLSSPVWHFERDELAPLASEKAGAVLALGEGLPGRIWATKKPEWLPNISDRPREPIRLRSRRRTLLKYGLHAAFGVPLYAEGKLQAILEFFSTARQPPDEHLLRIVESIGEQLGRVLERNRGREQQRRAAATADALTLTQIRSEALEATLNALTSGVYLADCHGRVVYMNPAAKRQIGTSNAIRVENGQLAPINRKARVALVKAIDEAIADEANLPTSSLTIALPGVGDNAGLIATVVRLGAFPGTAAIFVQDPILTPLFPGQAFADLYGLTRSEVRVLLAMMSGLCVKEAAQMLGICESTAKTHLRHLYSKTGTSKQTELMHLFMSSMPPVSGTGC